MKLTSRSDLVKPDGPALRVAALTAALTLLAAQAVLWATDRSQTRMDRFGTAAVHALAELAVEPLIREDRLHLGVIGNRLADTEEIRGVAAYSPDHELIVSSGDLEGPQYHRAVTVGDDNVIGHVRLALHPPAFARTGAARPLAFVALALLLPLLVASAWTFGRAIRGGALRRLAPRRRDGGHDDTARGPDEAAVPAEVEELPAPREIRHYLLAINLYNQFTLQPKEREFELALAVELAEAVANAYQGQVVNLPGVGALLDFDHVEDDDRPFEVLRGAFVLMRLLNDEAPFGHYRLGLHLALRPADEALPLDDPAVADAALLSALARSGSIAVSAPFADALPGPERCANQPLVNPLLDELATSGPGCRLITELEAPFAAAAAQQAEQLKTQRDDPITSPSTF